MPDAAIANLLLTDAIYHLASPDAPALRVYQPWSDGAALGMAPMFRDCRPLVRAETWL